MGYKLPLIVVRYNEQRVVQIRGFISLKFQITLIYHVYSLIDGTVIHQTPYIKKEAISLEKNDVDLTHLLNILSAHYYM